MCSCMAGFMYQYSLAVKNNGMVFEIIRKGEDNKTEHHYTTV